MSLTYTITDRDARLITEVPLVLAPVALSAVETTLNSNLVTVNSTANLFPGMPVAIPNVPRGAFIHAIINDTSIELLRSVYSAGAWTTVAANANATADATSLTGYAYGYHHECLIEQAYAMGMWRNLHSARAIVQTQMATATPEMRYHEMYGRGVAIVPTAFTVNSVGLIGNAAEVRTSDDLAASPAKRHNGEVWGVRPFVQSSGALSHVPARPDWAVVMTAVAA